MVGIQITIFCWFVKQTNKQTFWNMCFVCRGRLAQRESVRLVIQRSEFDSRRRIGEYFFLAVAEKFAGPRFIRKILLFSGIIRSTPSTGQKVVFNSTSVWKGTHPKIGPMTSNLRGWMTSYIFYCTIQIIRRHCNLLQYQLTDLTYGGVRALIGNRPRRQEGPPGDRYEDNRTG